MYATRMIRRARSLADLEQDSPTPIPLRGFHGLRATVSPFLRGSRTEAGVFSGNPWAMLRTAIFMILAGGCLRAVGGP